MIRRPTRPLPALATLAAVLLPALSALTPLPASAAPAAGYRERMLAVGAEPSMADRFPQVPVAFPGGVKAWRDVTYQQQPGFRPQIVDIYVPAGKGPHPLVVYTHIPQVNR